MTPEARQILEMALQLSLPQRAEVAHQILQSLKPEPKFTIRVHQGDIIKVQAEAVLTCINSRGFWGIARYEKGELIVPEVPIYPPTVDGALQQAAGMQFHEQARQVVGHDCGTTVVAHTRRPHRCHFQKVVFVVDDVTLPLFDIVQAGLRAADAAGIRSLSIPMLRTGAAARWAGPQQQVVSELVRAVRQFHTQSKVLREFHLVVHNSPEIGEFLHQALVAPASPLASVHVQIGDITRVNADALIVPINSGGFWNGGVDRAIYAVAGQQYHDQARALLGKPDGSTLLAERRDDHPGTFEKVLFVIDDLRLPLYEVVSAALRAAREAGLSHVTLPAMRTGVLLHAGGPIEEKIADLARAAREAAASPGSLRSLRFVIYGDPVLCETLRAAIQAR